MSQRVRAYALALLSVLVAAAFRFALVPVLGYTPGFAFFLVSAFVSGRYLGFGPSLFAVVSGVVPALALNALAPGFFPLDPLLLGGLVVYLGLGAIIIFACKSEHEARAELRREIVERQAAEDVLRAGEARLQGILDNTTAVIFLKDLEGRYILVNRRWRELFGATQRRMLGFTSHEPFPKEIADALQANDRLVAESGKPIEVEETVPHQDGLHTYITVKFPIKDAAQTVVAVGGISTDITERKRALEALEAEQELLRRAIEVQDQERQLICFEIHDGLVQYATGALMHLEAIRNKVEAPAIAAEVETALAALRKVVAEGRRLINGIRTPVLDDLGVFAALDQLIEEEERAHVEVEFVKHDNFGRMPRSAEEALFRIAQEALTNARKHSQSKKISIELGRQGDRVRLEVRDWGVGFTPSGATKGIHGIKGMYERARIAGGRCTVESAPGQGTKIVVDLPYLPRATT